MIELKNITYKVTENGKEKIILDDISCVFEDGKIIAITGHNGGGKSTLAKIIMGIISPTSGEIFYNGMDITKKTIEERARLGLNYAFQQPVTFQGITIKKLIDLSTGTNNNVPTACEYLSRVGVCAKDYINRNFDKTLSGGEQKRIEIALAIAKKGDTLIFDEPEAGIDLWSFDRLNNLFEEGKTYIVISHQTRLLSRADKIMVINNGKIEYYGKSDLILEKLNKMSCARVEEGGIDG